MSAFQTREAEQLHTLLAKQRRAALTQEPWTAAQRCELIDRAIGLLVDHEREIVAAISADFGHRSADFSRLAEVMSPILSMKQTQAQIEGWMAPEQRPSATGQAWVEYQPLGVVGIVTPWNFPVNVIFNGLAGVLAAGNRAMIKPSEFTPATSALIARLIGETFSEDEVAVVTGGAEVAQAFCALPFDHLMFTGSTSVGRHVMRAAADNLVPVTLELGGKSPTIVSRTADIAEAALKIMTGKTMNAGQICLAPDYALVPRESLGAFIAAAGEAVSSLFASLLDNPDYSSLINAQHHLRLQGYLAQAREAGVQLIELNPADEDFSQQPHFKLPPTLLVDPGPGLQVMQDEIFGPLLPIVAYDDFADVIAYINARPRPLGLYYFGTDSVEEQLVLSRTHSGGVTLNDVVRHATVEHLPFGGVGASGMGAYHGFDGFRTFSHAKAVYRTVEQPDLLRPPFDEPLRQLMTTLIAR